MANMTKQDAYQRVLDARVGSLDGASDEYLQALSHQLALWLAIVDCAVETRSLGADDSEPDCDDGCYRGCGHETVTTADGCGAYCKHCGLTLE